MRNALVTLALLALGFPAHAASTVRIGMIFGVNSEGQPEKATVVLNELGTSVLKDQLMSKVLRGGGSDLEVRSAAGDVRITCKASSFVTSCTLQLLVSERMLVEGRTFHSEGMELKDFSGVEGLLEDPSRAVSLSLDDGMGHLFALRMGDGKFEIEGRSRGLP